MAISIRLIDGFRCVLACEDTTPAEWHEAQAPSCLEGSTFTIYEYNHLTNKASRQSSKEGHGAMPLRHSRQNGRVPDLRLISAGMPAAKGAYVGLLGMHTLVCAECSHVGEFFVKMPPTMD